MEREIYIERETERCEEDSEGLEVRERQRKRKKGRE